MGDHPPLDIDRVVEVFDRHRVQYLLVGAGDLDVLRSLRGLDGGRRSCGELAGRSVAVSVNDVEIRLAGLGDIIDSNRFADREKDHDALPELEALRAASTEGNEP